MLAGCYRESSHRNRRCPDRRTGAATVSRPSGFRRGDVPCMRSTRTLSRESSARPDFTPRSHPPCRTGVLLPGLSQGFFSLGPQRLVLSRIVPSRRACSRRWSTPALNLRRWFRRPKTWMPWPRRSSLASGCSVGRSVSGKSASLLRPLRPNVIETCHCLSEATVLRAKFPKWRVWKWTADGFRFASAAHRVTTTRRATGASRSWAACRA